MRDLNRLVKPKTIAIIGGGVCCRSVIEQCQKIGFKGGNLANTSKKRCCWVIYF